MRIRSSRVADYCTRKVMTVRRETPIEHRAKLMHDEHVGTVVVVIKRKKLLIPVGIITDRDIAIEVVAFGLDASALTAGDLMAEQLATVSEDTDLIAALASMRDHGVRRLPVLDGDGALAGIVSADDLLALLSSEMDGLASLIRAEQSRERVTRASR
jgi:CBS-domain-containing membrane protein